VWVLLASWVQRPTDVLEVTRRTARVARRFVATSSPATGGYWAASLDRLSANLTGPAGA